MGVSLLNPFHHKGAGFLLPGMDIMRQHGINPLTGLPKHHSQGQGRPLSDMMQALQARSAAGQSAPPNPGLLPNPWVGGWNNGGGG